MLFEKMIKGIIEAESVEWIRSFCDKELFVTAEKTVFILEEKRLIFMCDTKIRSSNSEIEQEYSVSGTVNEIGEVCKSTIRDSKGMLVWASIKEIREKNGIKEFKVEDRNKERNTGDCNTRNRNTGSYNTGSYNTGNCNTGNYNTGDCNTGDYNTGDCNTGYYNTGSYNTGYYNTGDCNTGDYNTGDCNTGYYNTGSYNTGYYNTGNYNTGEWNNSSFNSGCFMTEEQKIMLFNRESNWTMREWLRSDARRILNQMPKKQIEWIGLREMSEAEKKEYPESEITGGYNKISDKTKNRQLWWDNLSENEKNTVKKIPNFDAEIFKEITGIQIED